MDYAPTFLDLAGILKADVIAGRQRFSGYSLKPFLEGRIPENWREETYTQSNGNECYGIQRSIFTDEYHLVFNGFDYDELYDLRKDPDCMKNVIEEQQYETVIYDLYRKLWRFAYLHRDALGDPYITTALARYGPGIIRGVKRE
nr:sulfatase/phosphatase domain-containing protein [Hungatella hathewayi]